MNRRLIFAVSACLNVFFAVILLGVWHRSKPSQALATGMPLDTNAVHTRVVVRKQFFAWQELESPDYLTYVGNLRSIGCPEPTIHDIIVADVNLLYAWK